MSARDWAEDTGAMERAVRARLWHYLSPEISASLGITHEQLRQAAIGRLYLEPWQLDYLARRMNVR